MELSYRWLEFGDIKRETGRTIVAVEDQTVVPQPEPAKSYSARNSHQKTAIVVPPEDGRLTPETCRGSRHNKVIVKVKVYEVGCVIVVPNS
jgi:hypothetical protein